MKKHVPMAIAIFVLFSVASAIAGVTISSPANGSTVSGSVNFKARVKNFQDVLATALYLPA